MQTKNLTMLTDFYQLTMMQGYFNSDLCQKKVVFDLFYRKNPCNNGFSIFCGLQQVVEYIKQIKFENDDIDYLKKFGIFSNDFLDYLKVFKFNGDIYAVKEGSVVFPQEPLLRVHANIMEAQFIETAILNIINHQSLIATKTSRIVLAAQKDDVLEFGARRAQGPDAAIFGARASIIGGCSATSNVLAGKMFDVPIAGTHAHSWVMGFEGELEAFREYAKNFKENCIFLVDTYNTLKSGLPNAIKVFNELKNSSGKLKKYGYLHKLDKCLI